MKPFHSHLLIPLTLWSSNLKRASGQNYLSTCKDCSLQQIKYLSCSCLTGLNGTLVNTTLDTDTCIGNDQWGNLFHGGTNWSLSSCSDSLHPYAFNHNGAMCPWVWDAQNWCFASQCLYTDTFLSNYNGVLFCPTTP